MAAISPEAQGIVDAMKAEITQFHALSKGNIESIGLLFSEMAQQPLPPQVICKILGMDEEAVKAAFEKGEPPTASEAMLFDAVLKAIDPGDTIEQYKPVFQRHIRRFENARSVMEALRKDLTALHTKVGGKTDKIEAFFADLAPEPQRGKPMPEGMINALLRIENTETVAPLEAFLDCFERNLDLDDSVAKIQPVLAVHL